MLAISVKILAPFDSSNTDGENDRVGCSSCWVCTPLQRSVLPAGVDIDSTTNVLVEDLYCYNGDDCIVVKSGMGPNGVRTARPSANIHASNISANGVAGIALGSEMSGGLRNIVRR